MNQAIANFSSFHKGLFDFVVVCSEKESLFQNEAFQAVEAFGASVENIQNVMDVTYRAQRIAMIFRAGLENNNEFYQKFEELDFGNQFEIEGVDVAPEMHQSLADKLYNITSPDDIALFIFGDKSREVAPLLLERTAREKIKFNVRIEDSDFMNLVFNHCDEAGANSLANHIIEEFLPSTKRVVCSTLMNEKPPVVQVEPTGKVNKTIYTEADKRVKEKSLRGDMVTTLTFIPTRAEALLDRIPYADYTRLFFEMCDQPWQQISDAQKFLIEKFNAASHARFTNEWGTDVQMELVDAQGVPFTFCNSLIAKNVPGSEIFSAPRRDSVNGRIVSRGLFNQDNADIIENLTLHFNNGLLDLWAAEKGVEHFTKFIEEDPNHRHVGELGIGTNPHLKQHVSNGLLVEKIGGSFHLALGGAYEMTDYMGEPVHVDNGNRAKKHWDITTMLYGASGRIFLDGKIIMEDGFFIDERLDVLNRGWLAVPHEQRPEYWKTAQTPFNVSP